MPCDRRASLAHVDVFAVRQSCVDFLPRLCEAVEDAVRWNGMSMSNTENAGVSHKDIVDAVTRVERLLLGTTGRVYLAGGSYTRSSLRCRSLSVWCVRMPTALCGSARPSAVSRGFSVCGTSLGCR